MGNGLAGTACLGEQKGFISPSRDIWSLPQCFENPHSQTQFARRRGASVARSASDQTPLPASEIFWWIDSKLAPLLEGDPDLAGVSALNAGAGRRRATGRKCCAASIGCGNKISIWVIDLQCLVRSGAFAWLANGNFLIGLDEPREGARGFYDVAVRRPSFYTHAVDWYLAVLPLLGVPVHWNFQWLPDAPPLPQSCKSKWQTGDARWIALQPGARWQNKRWPVEYFTELVRLWLAKNFPDARFAILGDEEDKPLGEIIARVLSRRGAWICAGDFLAGNGRVAAAQRSDGDQRHRPDARGRRARHTAWSRCSAPPNRAAPGRMASSKTSCALTSPARLALNRIALT